MLLVIEWDKVIESSLINIVSGFLVSFLFLFLLLFFFRPKVSISPKICCIDESYEDENNVIKVRKKYSFKIVNKSIYHAFDAKFELFALEPTAHIRGNSNLKITHLTLRTSNRTHIPRFRKSHYKKDPFAMYAILLHTNDNILSILEKENTYVEFKVTLRHGLTGLSDCFVQQFSNQDVVVNEHKFNFGNKIDTVPINKTV